MESAAPPQRTAVVSGLGPNGVLAALELLRCGYQVTVVEKRPTYTRPIHLHLRATYLEDVCRLSLKLHARLMEISTPIEENLRTRHPQPGPLAKQRKRWLDSFRRFFRKSSSETQPPQGCEVTRRLLTQPLRHVRLDSLERLFYSYLNGLTRLTAEDYGSKRAYRVVIRRGFHLYLKPDASHRYSASIRKMKSNEDPENLGFPDLVVLAEGGKSSSVSRLGLETVRFSHPKHFMSAHVDVPFGPRTHRIDADVRQLLKDPSTGAAEVSLWACGHGDPAEGTWVVIEVPEGILTQLPEQAENLFVEGAMVLLGSEPPARNQELRQKIRRSVAEGAILTNSRRAMDRAEGTPFAGTFKFEQQCLLHPAAGHNVVVLGDAAGMGHHALSSGLEMGACDLAPLRRLVQDLADAKDPAAAVDRYAQTVYRSRITLLALGMREYYPTLLAEELDLLRAADFFGSGQA